MCTNLCVKNVTNKSTFLQISYIRSQRAKEQFWKRLIFKSTPFICYLFPHPASHPPWPPQLPFGETGHSFLGHRNRKSCFHDRQGRSEPLTHHYVIEQGTCLLPGNPRDQLSLQVPVGEFPPAPYSALTWMCLKQESFPSQADTGISQTGS